MPDVRPAAVAIRSCSTKRSPRISVTLGKLDSNRADEILDQADLALLPLDTGAALLCVERDPEACHRLLIAERLAAEHGISVLHLRP